MKAYNRTRQTWLVTNLRVADTFFRRAIGLMGRTALDPGEGLWIIPCQSIHTFGMRFPIDVLFLDRHGRVVKLISELKPRRLVLPVMAATSVLELPAGTIARTATEVGDVVSMTAADDQAREPSPIPAHYPGKMDLNPGSRASGAKGGWL